MFKLTSIFLFASGLAHAEFNAESLVLTDGPRQIELISLKAESHLKMSYDLDQALQQACIDSKAVLLIIVGGNGCPWSEKLLMDVVYKPEFYQEAQKSFVLCKLEVEHLLSKGKELGIEQPLDKIPLFILMNKEGKVISEKHDLPETPKEGMVYLKEAINTHTKIDKLLTQAQTITEEVLESYYKKAKILGLKCESILYNLGTQKKKNIYFILEKYQKLLMKGLPKEIKDLKLDIQRLDPRNSQGAIRSMAIMDFEEKSRQKKGMENPFSALKPLFEYLRDYGHYDKECRWEIEMKIARFLYSKNQLQAAIQHASRSLDYAPESKKSEVAEAVEFLKKQKEIKP
jgi:thioredoxin-related protein